MSLIDIETDGKLLNEKEQVLMNLAVIQGGKSSTGSGTNPPDDWLSELEVGTIFLVEEKNNIKNFNLGQFQVVTKTDKAVHLASMLNGLVQTFVKPLAFCNQYRLYEVLGIISDKGTENGTPPVVD